MPRRQRLQIAGLPVHIIQRGNNRQACFFADEDYLFFLDHLARIAKRFRCALHAYVLIRRQAAYRGLFAGEIDPQELREIRVSTHGGYAIGCSRFRDEVERTLALRATPHGPGRPVDKLSVLHHVAAQRALNFRTSLISPITISFAQRIAAMNARYRLPAHSQPLLPANVVDQLIKFKATLLDEVHEIDEIVQMWNNGGAAIDIAVAIADLLGDIIVYCRSEALKYGLPLEEVLDVIMDSNESKLDANGNPIYDANGKFLKGPNYWRPEPKIKPLIRARMNDEA